MLRWIPCLVLALAGCEHKTCPGAPLSAVWQPHAAVFPKEKTVFCAHEFPWQGGVITVPPDHQWVTFKVKTTHEVEMAVMDAFEAAGWKRVGQSETGCGKEGRCTVTATAPDKKSWLEVTIHETMYGPKADYELHSKSH